MSEIDAAVYSEVNALINLAGNDLKELIPNKLKQMINEKMDKNYNPIYRIDIPLEKQNIKKESLAMIANIHYSYWCRDEEEKQELLSELKQIDKAKEEELREKYNPDNIFKNKQQESSVATESVAMVEYKENIFKRIWNKFISLFKK